MLLRRREQGHVHIRRSGHGAADLGHGGEQRADARVRILDVVDGVFAVLPDGEVEVKLQMRVRLGVEEEAAGIHADLVHEVSERERLTRALGDLDDLVAAHEAHHLHDEEVELAALEPQRGRAHGRGEANGVAVVIRAPDVDDAVKAVLRNLRTYSLTRGTEGAMYRRFQLWYYARQSPMPWYTGNTTHCFATTR